MFEDAVGVFDGVEGLGSYLEDSSYVNGFCLPRFRYTVVIKMASAITTKVMVIVSGDQNPLLTVAGACVGAVIVLVNVPVGVPIGVGEAAEGEIEPPLVTLKSALAVSPSASVAIKV